MKIKKRRTENGRKDWCRSSGIFDRQESRNQDE
jgi:hypothetical protein